MTITSGPDFIEPYMIMYVTIEKESANLKSIVEYEIPPLVKMLDGSIAPVLPTDYEDDQELKQLVTDALAVWDDQVKASYEAYLRSNS